MVGPYRLDRPAPQAIWQPTLSHQAWSQSDALYHRSKSGGGRWEFKTKIRDSWQIQYGGLTLKIKLTDFGHLGLFAEQAENWRWMQHLIQKANRPLRVLNTFAYTGGASLAAAAAGAQVTHLDAAKGIVSWAKENAAVSNLSKKPIRWIVDDVAKFVAREQRRGNSYDGLILDPPSFGRGPKGNIWKFETDLPPLLAVCRAILSEQPVFILLSAHTPGFSPLGLENLLGDMMQGFEGELSSQEMIITQADSNRTLPSGMMARWTAK
ncbi:MAG: class I SAM-dependent methyltransferase [Chloroflexota bacterium]